MTLDPSVQKSLLAAIPKLRAFAISLCRNKEQAEDLVQSTLLRAWANISSFAPGSNMDGWLFTILRNLFYSEYRRCRNFSRIMVGFPEADATSPQQIASVEYSQVYAALAKLDAKHREALMLVGAAGLSYDEAASVCGCPVGTVKSRVNRARAELARVLSSHGQEYIEADAVFSAAIGSGEQFPPHV
jgi:RNA polymerase sigma-70 factor (ECF subfamily)